MTLPSSGPLTLGGSGANSISQEFTGRGSNLAAYRGVQWWKDNTATGYFTSTNLGMNQFYEKRSTTPVTPGSTTLGVGTSSWYVPLYSILNIVVRGGGGGGGGGSSNTGGGGTGSSGGSSYFGASGYYTSASGGSGGYPGGSGSNGGPFCDGSPGGGSGGSSGYVGYPAGGPGGAGGKSATLSVTNPVSSGPGPTVATYVPCGIGGGGGGGSGGSGLVYTGIPPFYYASANGGGGGTGGNGYIELSWS